jgi:hypothetical protein
MKKNHFDNNAIFFFSINELILQFNAAGHNKSDFNTQTVMNESS